MTLLNSLLAKVPWLPTALAWAVALIVLWLVVSFPAYLLIPVMRSVRAQIAAWLSAFRGTAAAAAAKRAQQEQSAIARLLASRSFWTPRIATDVRAARQRLEELARHTQRVQERLGAHVIPTPSFPEIPTVENGIRETAAARLAWLYVVIGGLMLVALMVVNTGMLSQILRELMPASIRIANVPLYFVFAFLLTFVEAGIGFVHGALSHSDDTDDPKPLKVSVLATLVAAIAIAFVEGFFYSQVGDPRRLFALTQWLSVRHDQIFFIWGAVLVMLLFGLGHVLIRSAQTIRATGAAKRCQRQLRNLGRKVEDSKGLFHDTEESLRSATLESASAASTIKNTAISTAVPPTLLSTADVEAIASRMHVWLAIAAIGLSVLGLIAARTPVPYWFGLGAGGASFVAGLLLRREDGAVQSGDRLTVIATSDRLRTVLAVVVLIGIVALHVYLFSRLSTRADVAAWLMSMVACAVMVGAGREAAGAIAVFGLGLRGIAAALISVLGWVVSAVVTAALLAAWLLENALEILARPWSWFRHSEPDAARAATDVQSTGVEHATVD